MLWAAAIDSAAGINKMSLIENNMYQFIEEPVPPKNGNRIGKYDDIIKNWPPGTSLVARDRSHANALKIALQLRGYQSCIRWTNQGIKVWKLSKDVAQS
jgi:hypothetical protein